MWWRLALLGLLVTAFVQWNLYMFHHGSVRHLMEQLETVR